MKTKATILLIVLGALITMSFKKEKKTNIVETKTYYYYAYGENRDDDQFEKLYITPLKTITINEDQYYPIDDAGLALQFRDYFESEYNASFTYEGEVYEADTFDKATATEYYRKKLKRYNKNIKQYDFEYLPEKR